MWPPHQPPRGAGKGVPCSGDLLLAKQAVPCVPPCPSDPGATSNATCLGGYLNIAAAFPLWCTPQLTAWATAQCDSKKTNEQKKEPIINI